MNVLLVHGFWNRGILFRRMEKRLTAAGHTCFAPTLHPRDARLGILDLAQKLAAYVNAQIPAGQPLAVVGFSMGCLVARSYLRSPLCDRPVPVFFAISGPMQGTLTAWLYPGQGARDMRPGSPFLKALNAPGAPQPDPPIHTYFTPLDLMILPTTSSRIAHGSSRSVPALWHRAMVSNPTVTGDILEKLQKLADRIEN